MLRWYLLHGADAVPVNLCSGHGMTHTGIPPTGLLEALHGLAPFHGYSLVLWAPIVNSSKVTAGLLETFQVLHSAGVGRLPLAVPLWTLLSPGAGPMAATLFSSCLWLFLLSCLFCASLSGIGGDQKRPWRLSVGLANLHAAGKTGESRGGHSFFYL